MKYTAKVMQVNTSQGEYLQTIEITAKDEQELNDLLDLVADGTSSPLIKIDDSNLPKNFYGAGGFASKVLSFTDENGKDFSHIVNGAF